MTPGPSGRPPHDRSRLVPGLGFAALLLAGACSPATPSSAPTDGSSPIEAAPSSTSSTGPAGVQAGQTDTDWGRIWDALPADFPVYPGAVQSDEAQTGPVSATFALNGVEPRAVATWMQAQLERAAFGTEGLNGPLEDGSFVLDSTGAGSCRIQVVAAPLGSVTTVTIRYGAACPNP